MTPLVGTFGALLLSTFFASGWVHINFVCLRSDSALCSRICIGRFSGVATVQAVVFFKLYPNDRRSNKILVGFHTIHLTLLYNLTLNPGSSCLVRRFSFFWISLVNITDMLVYRTSGGLIRAIAVSSLVRCGTTSLWTLAIITLPTSSPCRSIFQSRSLGLLANVALFRHRSIAVCVGLAVSQVVQRLMERVLSWTSSSLLYSLSLPTGARPGYMSKFQNLITKQLLCSSHLQALVKTFFSTLTHVGSDIGYHSQQEELDFDSSSSQLIFRHLYTVYTHGLSISWFLRFVVWVRIICRFNRIKLISVLEVSAFGEPCIRLFPLSLLMTISDRDLPVSGSEM